MLSRIFWVGLAGIALLTGMALQDGDWIFGSDLERDITARTERAVERSVERSVERAIDQSFDGMEVVGEDGREIDVPRETKRAMAAAVGRLIKAETDLAMAKMGDESSEEVEAATARRDQARAEVDRLKSAIEGEGEAAVTARQEVRDEVRAEIREAVREAVRN